MHVGTEGTGCPVLRGHQDAVSAVIRVKWRMYPVRPEHPEHRAKTDCPDRRARPATRDPKASRANRAMPGQKAVGAIGVRRAKTDGTVLWDPWDPRGFPVLRDYLDCPDHRYTVLSGCAFCVFLFFFLKSTVSLL